MDKNNDFTPKSTDIVQKGRLENLWKQQHKKCKYERMMNAIP